jgi:hypothetical protein
MGVFRFYGCGALALVMLACGGNPTVTESDGNEGDRNDNGSGTHTSQDGGAFVTGDNSNVVIGAPPSQGDGGAGGNCKPATCESIQAECGSASDGCGGVLQCGQCTEGEFCGILQHNVCTNPDSLCVPIEQAVACEGKECGKEGDGCQGFYECGACKDGDVCGAITPFMCDEGVVLGDGSGNQFSCAPLTAEQACEGKQCGKTFDGCGATAEHIFDCADVNGGCAADEWCGIEEAFQCSRAPGHDCNEEATCASMGWGCGVAVDACGNVFDCAAEGLTCDSSTETCVGGVDAPAQCVAGEGGAVTSNCEVCGAIPTHCASPTDTKLTGRVITPGKNAADSLNQVGVPNAFVYILKTADSSSLPPLDAGIPTGGTSCDRCTDQDLGPVLSSATTDYKGEYTLSGNIPVGEPFVLVVKIGKWRRAVEMTLSDTAACASTAIDPQNTRLPRTSTDGLAANIPRIAISTGAIDAMECVFLKMGVAASEFVNGSATTTGGRVHMYQGGSSGTPGGLVDNNTPADVTLHGDKTRMFSYDMVVFDCEGMGYAHHNTSDVNIREYVNSGGRMFASHLSWTWLQDNGNAAYTAASSLDTGLASSVSWGSDDYDQTEGTGFVSIDRPGANPAKVQKYADWLEHEDAAAQSNGEYSFEIIDPRPPARSVGQHTEEYVYKQEDFGTSVQQLAFNTPYGAPGDAICGRVAYSSFHVCAGGGTTPFEDEEFPGYCQQTGENLTPQEKTLLYMLFDLGACVTTEVPEPPVCTPVDDCAGRCGVIPDGCGGTVDCSGCPNGETCLAGGVCSDLECVPTTCTAQNAECGYKADGCGGALDCGSCSDGKGCGVDTANKCGDVPECTVLTCEQSNAECGFVGDGCGGAQDCGKCPQGEICGLKTPHKCDPPPTCVPTTCEQRDAECGTISDGCGEVLDCGTCPGGAVCGLRKANQCAGSAPVPL